MSVLVDNGVAEYQIVTPGRFCPAENHAALNLQKYLYAMTGAMLPVRWGDRLIPRKAAIRVGLVRYEPRGLWDKDWYEIRPEGADLKLFGCNSRGAHYAVFAFLESLGARFLGPGEERLPHLARVDMPANPIRSTAAFGMRHVFYPTPEEPEWAIRWKLNVHDGRDERWGENAAPHSSGHSFDALVPPEEFFQAHPEYYSLVDGRRRSEEFGHQLCCTNPRVAEIVAERLGQWIAAHPDKRIFAVAQNDGDGWCECPECARVAAREGSVTGPLMTLVNRMAERFPDRIIATLAYAGSIRPPLEMAVRDNVLVVLCHNEGCFNHALDACPHNEPYLKLLREWRRRARHLRIWDYFVNYSSYLMPTFNFRRIGRDMPFYQDIGVEGFFCQGSACRGGDFEGIRMYLLSRMLWDPREDAWAIVEEWTRGVYGRAAEPILEYLTLFEDHVRHNAAHMSTFGGGQTIQPDIFTPELRERGRKLWDAAEAAAGSEELRRKVFAARAPEMCSRLFNAGIEFQETPTGLVPAPPPDVELRDRFVQAAILKGASALREDQGAPEDFARLYGRTYRGATLESPALRTLVLPEMGGRLYSLKWREGNRDLLLTPNIAPSVNFAPFTGGYDFSLDRLSLVPGRGAAEEYRMIEAGSSHAVLEEDLGGSLVIRTRYEVCDDTLLATHTVANNGAEAARISPRANPEWHMAVFDNDCELDLLGPDGRWRTVPVNPDGRSSRDVIYRDADMPAGAWRLRSGKSGFAVDGAFDAAATAYVKMVLWLGRSIHLEVHFHDQELAPHASVVFATRWRISRPQG